MKTYLPYLLLAALVGIAAAVYWNTLPNEFVNIDDPDLIVENSYIRTLSFENLKAIFTPGVVGAYQPVRTLSYALDYHVWQLDPTGYHLTNIVCHALSTLLVALIAYRLAAQWLLAGAVGLIFAVHPVHVEAVAWLSGRRDVLSLVFTLLGFYSIVRLWPPPSSAPPKRRGWVWYGLALLFFALGLLTKSTVVIFPLLLLLYEISFRPSIVNLSRRIAAHAPFWLFAAGFTAVFISVSRAQGVAKAAYHGDSAYLTLLTVLRVFAEYLAMLVIPRQLSLTYGVNVATSILQPSVLLALAVLAVVAGLTVLARKRTKLVFFGIGWFFLGLLPVSNLIPISTIKADRYLYLPSVGFCLAAAWLVVRCWQALAQLDLSKLGKKLVIAGYWLLIAIIVLSYAMLTVRRNHDWRNSHTLWTATLATTPTSTIALNNLGLIYAEQGMYDKALALYQQLLDYAPHQDRVERVYVNIGSAYLGKGMFDEAIDSYQTALETNPEYVEAYLGLGKVSQQVGQYRQAIQIYESALELNPRNEVIYTRLGNVYFVQGKYDEALRYYQRAHELNPVSIAAYNAMGLCYAAQGDAQTALDLYRQALTIDPNAAVIHNSLGSLYMRQGDLEQAIAEFQTSLQQDPDNVEVRNNLGVLFLRTEQYREALREFMAALERQPDNPQIMTNLGTAYQRVGLYDEAKLLYQQALQVDATLDRTHVRLGDVCLLTDDPACAVEAYQRALALRGADENIRARLNHAKDRLASGAESP